jgi:hypothetical protein
MFVVRLSEPRRSERNASALIALILFYTTVYQWKHDITEHRSAREKIERLKHKPYRMTSYVSKRIISKS